MNRRLSILVSLLSTLLLVILLSACKPDSRSSPAQLASTAITQPMPTTTMSSSAPAVVVTATTSKPPVCQFNKIIPDSLASPASINNYTVSPLTVILTDTSEIDVYGWLPDNDRLIIGRWNPSRKKATLDTLRISTRLIQTYAERTDAGGDRPIWLPDLQAIAYTDFDLPQEPSSLPGVELWISQGNPDGKQLLAEHVAMNSLTLDSAGQLAYLFSQKNTEPIDLSVKTVSAASMSMRNIPLPAALNKPPTSMAESSSEVEMPFGFIHRPATSQAALLYKNQPPLVFDLNSGQICQIELPSYVSEALWSPDGRFLAMRTQNMPIGFTASDVLTILDTNTNQHYEVDFGTHVYSMVWSPNSQHLAVLTQKQNAVPEHQVHQDLFLVDAVTREHRRLFPDYDFRGGAIQHYQMAWSPNGETLAITCPVWPPNSAVITESQLCAIQFTLSK
jgi:hypothetical protein